MKVLWFVNIQMPDFIRRSGGSASVFGGWMSSLLSCIRQNVPDLKIGVAFVGRTERHDEINGVSYFSLGNATHGVGKWQFMSRGFVENCEKVISQFKPDIIHVHGSEGIALSLCSCRFGRIPLTISLQGIISGYYPHYLGGLTEGEIRPFRNYFREMQFGNLSGRAELWRVQKASQERQLLRRVDSVMGRTDWDKAWASALAPNAPYFNVGEILRPEFYRASPHCEHGEGKNIYTSAAFTYPLKGGHWLLRALAILREKHPDVHVRIPASNVARHSGIVGRMKQRQYHRYLEHLIMELNLSDNVTLLPRLTADSVVQELNAATMFVLPSCVENSPNSLAEAQIVGVPAVATYVGGVPSMIKDGEEGLLVPSCDPGALASAIEKMLLSKNLREKLAKNARVVAIARHDPVKIVRELISAYEGTIGLKSCHQN